MKNKNNPEGNIFGKNIFSKISSLIVIGLLILLAGGKSVAAAISSTGTGGAWNATTTWAGGVIPGTNDDVTIVSGATVTVPASAICRSLTITGTLNFTGTSITMTISNNSPLVLNSGSNLLIGATNILYFSNTNGGSGITNNGGTIVSTGTNGADGGTIKVNIGGGGNFNITGTGSTTVYNLDFLQNAHPVINSSLLVNGTFYIRDNNVTVDNSTISPIWGPGSTIYINNNNQGMGGGSVGPTSPLNNNFRKLWTASTGTIGTTPGYPNNVTILNIGNSNGGYKNGNGWVPTGTWTINGTLTLGDGSAVNTPADFSGMTFTCGGFVLTANARFTAPTGTMTVNGNWIDNQVQVFTSGTPSNPNNPTKGFYINGTSTVNFGGSGTCSTPNIIQGPTGVTESFYNLGIINGTFTKLNSPVSVSNTLALTSGIIATSSTNTLSVTNTSTSAITGGSANTYISGPVNWSMQAGAGTYLFPVGSNSVACANDYLPFTLNKVASSTFTATVEGVGAASGGTGDATVGAMSTTEYWSLTTGGTTLPTGSTITSVTRATPAVAALSFLAESKTAPTGIYTSIGGTSSATGVSNTNDIGSGTSFYFAISAPPIVSTLAATNITTTGATLNGAFNTGGTSKVTSFSYGTTTAYGTTVNSTNSPMNTTVATPDAIAITGLTPNTIYHYQASDGTDNGSDVTFVTAPNAPTMGAGSNPTNTGFTASWSAPTGMGTAPFTYTVEVSTDPAFGTITSTQTGISGTSYAFTGLNPTTQYYYRVKAVNATASSAWSAVSAGISTLIVPTGACTSGSGSGTSPGAITFTYTAPVVDGSVDAVWSNVPANVVSNLSVGSGSNTATNWKAMWTADTLYMLIQVQDATLISQNTGLPNSTVVPGATPGTSSNYYDFDGVEITLDPLYDSHTQTSYDGKNDVQFRFNLGATVPSGQSCGCATQFTGTMFTNVYNRIHYKVIPGGMGYIVEAAIPWGQNATNPGINLSTSPSTYTAPIINQFIGVEVQVNDATNTGGRSAQYSWYNSSSAPYQDPSQFAKAQLVPACATPPTVVNPKVTNITATGATFGATVTSSGDSPLTSRGTGYTASPNNAANQNAIPEGGTSVSAYSGPARTGLSPQTKYFYLGYATNSHGATGVSDTAFFYTLSALPTAQPTLTSNACSQMILNWSSPGFPASSQATQTGYLLLRADAPATPSTTGITTRVATQQSDLAAGTTLVATIASGSTLTYTDATAVAGTTYNYMLVPFTWDGVTADSTYNYAVTSTGSVSASLGSISAPGAIVSQQPSCALPTGTISISPFVNSLTYSIDGTNYVAGPDFTGLTPNTTYNVTAKNSGGCTSSATSITIGPASGGPAAPTATIIQPSCEVATGAISINATAGYTYSIDGTNYLSASDPKFTALLLGNYQLTAKDGTGCTSGVTTISIVALTTPCGEFKIPNLVTPNNDGHNDMFAISALPAGSKLDIFNRWGDRVYESSNYDNLWAGSNGSDGVYYYDLILPDGKEFKGWLQIIK